MDSDDASTSDYRVEYAPTAKTFRTTTFNLEPEIIPRNSLTNCSLTTNDYGTSTTYMNGGGTAATSTFVGGTTAKSSSSGQNCRRQRSSRSGADEDLYDLDVTTEHQLKQIREDSRKRVRRLVASVGITLTILCIVLVIVSLSFGPKLEELSSSMNGRSPFSSNNFIVNQQQQQHYPILNNVPGLKPAVGNVGNVNNNNIKYGIVNRNANNNNHTFVNNNSKTMDLRLVTVKSGAY